MNHSTHTKRTSGAIAITALAGLFAIAPAYAADDVSGLTPADVRVWDGGGRIDVPRVDTLPPVPSNTVEYVQIGLGVLGGMAVVAAGVAAASTVRKHGEPHPA